MGSFLGCKSNCGRSSLCVWAAFRDVRRHRICFTGKPPRQRAIASIPSPLAGHLCRPRTPLGKPAVAIAKSPDGDRRTTTDGRHGASSARPPANRHARNVAVSTRRLFAWAVRIAVRHAMQNIGSCLLSMCDSPFRASQNRPNRERAGRFDGVWQKGGGTLQKRMRHISARRCGNGGEVRLDSNNRKSLRAAGALTGKWMRSAPPAIRQLQAARRCRPDDPVKSDSSSIGNGRHRETGPPLPGTHCSTRTTDRGCNMRGTNCHPKWF